MEMSIGEFVVNWKLVAIFIVASLAVGVIVGLVINEVAKLKARIDPETYQFFDKGNYVSIGNGKDLSDRNLFLWTFLNAFKDYSFVSEFDIVVHEVLYYGIHLLLAGVISYFAFYIIPSWISLFNRTSRSQA